MSRAVSVPTPFRRGYIASTFPPALRDLEGWHTRRVADLWFALHPETFWAHARRANVEVVILGEPVDIERRTTNRSRIARQVAASLTTSIDAAVRHVAYLGGRASYFLVRDGEVVVVPDYASTHPIYWHQSSSVVTFSNFAHLVGEVTGAELNSPYIELMSKARALGANRTIYWPGIETPFMGVNPVLANHVARFRRGQSVQHKRFYPFRDTALVQDVDLAYEAFREQFVAHVRLLTSLTNEIGVSLTGGRDSQATLTAALPFLKRSRARTWTYVSKNAPASMVQDAHAARDFAQARNVRHEVLDLGVEISEAFESARVRTFRYTPQFAAVPRAYATMLPASIVELKSMVAECGTGFYKSRKPPFSLDEVVRLYQNSPFGSHPLVRAAYERYLEYSGLAEDDISPLDWQDVLYQESRAGRWAALRIQEAEFAHRVHLPFNARGIIEALSGPAIEDRVGKQALVRFIEEHRR